MKSNGEKRVLKYLCIYTIIFILLITAAYFSFWKNGRGLVRYSDGLEQFYYSLRYYGKYLREFVYNILINGKLQLPMWDMGIGYGSDVLATLHCYVIGDPLNLLSVFFDETNVEYLFQFLMIFRIYLAGLSFSAFCFYHGNKWDSTLMGAIVYCFCGWTLVTGMAYAPFTNPMIYFPLLLLGIDKIFKKEKPYLFIAMTTISALSYFYFFYMLCIFAFLYAIFAYKRNRYEFKIKSIMGWLGKFLGYFMIGVCISAIILLPVLITVLSQQRLGMERDVPLLYSIAYYLLLPAGFVTYLPIGNDQVTWGFASVALPAVIFLFCEKHKNTELKMQFILLNFFAILPVAGMVMNGFSYPSNRWAWAYCLLTAYIVVKEYPVFAALNKKQIMALILIAVLYVPYWLFVYEKITVELIMFELIIVVFVLFNIMKKNHKFLKYVLFACTGISVAFNAYLIFSVRNLSKSYLNNIPFGTIYNMTQELPMRTIAPYTDVVRYDQYNLDKMEMINSDIVLGSKGTRYQYSLGDSSIAQYYDELYINSFCSFHYDNLDGRSILDTLASVKYYMINRNEEYYLPWNYHQKVHSDMQNYDIYENERALPLGYTFSSYIPYEDWIALPVEQRQYALMQGAVLRENTGSLSKTELEFCNQELPYQVESETIKWGSRGIETTQSEAKADVKFSGLPESEYYLIFEDLDFAGDSNIADIVVKSGDVQKVISYGTKNHNQATGKNNFLCNLGYFADGIEELEITFVSQGAYQWSEMRISCQPINNLKRYTEDLQKNVLQNIKLSINNISGTISVTEDKLLCLSLPYRAGWIAYLDGEKTDIMQTNTMFMGIQVGPGEHLVELKYHTPGLYAGACVTVAGVVLLLILRLKEKKCEKNKVLQ